MEKFAFLNDSSLLELVEIKTIIEQKILAKQKQERNEFIISIQEQAKQFGLSNEALSQAILKTKTSKTDLPPKYRNPLNHEEAWTGRGRKPKWLVTALNQGKALEEFAI